MGSTFNVMLHDWRFFTNVTVGDLLVLVQEITPISVIVCFTLLFCGKNCDG